MKTDSSSLRLTPLSRGVVRASGPAEHGAYGLQHTLLGRACRQDLAGETAPAVFEGDVRECAADVDAEATLGG